MKMDVRMGLPCLKQMNNNDIYFETWPSLPVPLAYMTGSMVGNEIYIAGGQTSTDEPSAGKHFFVLNLRNRDQGWKSIDAWPGPARSFAVSASQSDGFDNCFYLFSGRDYGPGKEIEVLHDGYEYNPRLGDGKDLILLKGHCSLSWPAQRSLQVSTISSFIGGDGGSLMYRQQERS
jgi:solute:Na+ symporter, SSS family